ncbi:hypothetical protein Bbelb_362930 [Branchiostoma belcheri]|nr:hypothetical protein Bbelb_362930 [Branchiostoma belcheri]
MTGSHVVLTASEVEIAPGGGAVRLSPAHSLRRSPKRRTFTKAILEANKGLHLYSGDITNVHRDSRNAIVDGWRWPSGVIPFVIGSEFSTSCRDSNSNCGNWASIGECDANPDYMLDECAQSCGLCGRAGSSNRAQKPTQRAYNADCYTDSTQMTGDSFTVNCPSGCSHGADVWGSGVYTDDSGVCRAAIHDGRLTNSGGRVTVYRWSGQTSYGGSTQHGVQTMDYGSWSSSFAFEPESSDLTGGGGIDGDSVTCSTDSTKMADDVDSMTVNCPSGCSHGADVYGTGVYTDDSGVCRAAIHDGRLTNSGGRVTVYRWPGQTSYQGSTKNGVQTLDYDAWGSSFAFEPAPDVVGGGIDGGTILTAPPGSEVGKIQAAIEEFNRVTGCIRFVPRTNEPDYVHIKRLDGCWSDIGVSGGMQELSLGSGCMWKGTILHELMHAVGFWHEHQRPDRDDYVTIMLNNVDPDEQSNFDKKADSRTLGLPYDYGSVMHYDSHAFSANDRQTIVPKQPLNGIVLGDTEVLSALDIQKIKKLYDCNK